MTHHFNIRSLSMILVFSAGSLIASTGGGIYKNLKALPQDITEKQLDSCMNAYCRALKVDCGFCHPPKPNSLYGITLKQPQQTDFAADNPMKEDARKMIRMQMELNRKFFYFDTLARPEFLNMVNCNTCHRGSPFPMSE